MSDAREVIVARPPRDVVVVSGGDALSFLQSLVSQDVDALADGQGAHTLLLTPQGKLDVDFVLLHAGDEAWLVVEGGFGEQLAASLNRFKIRVVATVEVRPDLDGLAVRGPGAVDAARAAGLPVPDERYAHAPHELGRVVRIPWPDGDGVDAIGAADALASAERALVDGGAQVLDGDGYDAVRIAAGIPRQGAELDGSTIPQEAFLELDAVSFTKGCFLGQELVCRIDTRGHVNRYLRGLRDITGARPPLGAELVAGDKVVGAVTSVAEERGGAPVALAYVRREIEPPADVVLRWDGGEATARVELLPA
jgi:folate-binding protein YgfZ